MDPFRRKAALAGSLYLLLVLVAPVRLVYVQNELFVPGDVAATMAHIAAHPGLFRLGILGDLFCATLEVFLTLALFQLFRAVDRRAAVLMAVLGLMPVPLYFFNVFNDVAIAYLVLGDGAAAGAGNTTTALLVGLAGELHDTGVHVLQIFWSAWLFPLALLAYRSRRVPRFIALWLGINGVAYLALSLAGLVAPTILGAVSILVLPAQLGEVVFTACLLCIAVFSPRRAQRAATA